MNLMPSKVGADPKKIAVLVGLVAVAGYFYFSNSNSGGGSPSAPIASRAPVAASPAIAPRVRRPVVVPRAQGKPAAAHANFGRP